MNLTSNISFQKNEDTILNALYEGSVIRFTGNGFNHSSVQEDGTFESRENSGDGWYTKGGRVDQASVQYLIAQGLIRVNIEHVGGVLVQENTLVLV